MSKKLTVAVVGATGAVGREMLKTLHDRQFPATEVRAFASARSAGTKVPFGDDELVVQELKEDVFEGIDIAIFSAGGSTSEKFAPHAAHAGCVVVDNSSQWRMDDRCPLVVPEVNPEHLEGHQGIIANPNCSTIQMLVALKPIHDAVGIKVPARRAWKNWNARPATCSTCASPKTRSILTASPSTCCRTSTSSWRTTTPRKK